MGCQSCGRNVATKQVNLYQTIGLLVARRKRVLSGHFCHACITAYFWEYTAITAVLGWWSILSALLSPLILINNIVVFIASRQRATATGKVRTLGAPPKDFAAPSVQCPDCYSSHIKPTKFHTALIATVIGASVLSLWGYSLLEAFVRQHNTDPANAAIGLVFLAVSTFTALSTQMVIRTRLRHCEDCGAIWPPL